MRVLRGERGEWRGPVAGHDGAWMEPWVVTVEPEREPEPLAGWRWRLAWALTSVADWCVRQAERLMGE